MNINRAYISTQNTYEGNNPQYIIVHNTDNFRAGANALAHASAQHNGDLVNMSVHYYVDDGDIVYQAAPYEKGCWHVGKDYGGRLFGTVNNRNTIGIEMCVQQGYNFDKAFRNTIELVKQVMKETGISADRVLQHYDVCGKNCPSQIRAKGKWDGFKQAITENDEKLYRVRKTWADEKSQIGAYKVLEYAMKACAKGYTIFDWNGVAVYTNYDDSYVDPSEDAFVKMVGPLASEDMKKSGILASVTAAQAILESGYGSTDLAANAKNYFGMKASLSGNTWGGSTWDGTSIYTKETKEQKADGTQYTITADFRKYPSIDLSIGDHSAYLLGAKNGDKLRYEGLKGCKEYRKAAEIIKAGGYATDILYVDRLCNIIERWKLTQYDIVPAESTWYRVRKSWSDEASQKGAYQVLEYAKRCADENPGYTVYDDKGSPVYRSFRNCPYMVHVGIADLWIRKGPGTNFDKVGYIPVGSYTIVEEQDGQAATKWGRLKSGAGWISLDFTTYV